MRFDELVHLRHRLIVVPVAFFSRGLPRMRRRKSPVREPFWPLLQKDFKYQRVRNSQEASRNTDAPGSRGGLLQERSERISSQVLTLSLCSNFPAREKKPGRKATVGGQQRGFRGGCVTVTICECERLGGAIHRRRCRRLRACHLCIEITQGHCDFARPDSMTFRKLPKVRSRSLEGRFCCKYILM